MRRVTPCPCPKCNHEVLIPKIRTKTASDFPGTVCQNCGYIVTEEDMVAQALKAAERMMSRIKP